MVNLFKTPFQNERQFDIKKVVDDEVPEPFRMNRQRNMPIAHFFGRRGYFLFPSENAYDIYKHNKNKIGKLDMDGIGIPLMHISPEFPSLGTVAGNSPLFMVWKYVLVPSGGPPLPVEFEVVAHSSEWCVYKVPFCEIYSNRLLADTEYRLVFPFERHSTSSCIIKKSLFNRDMYTYVGEASLRWHVNVMSDHYRLQILGESVPNLLDDSATAERKKKLNKAQKTIDIAHYTRTYRDVLPHRNSKEASLYVGERSPTAGFGIADVPWITQVLACQGLLIQYLEYERRQKNKKNAQQQ